MCSQELSQPMYCRVFSKFLTTKCAIALCQVSKQWNKKCTSKILQLCFIQTNFPMDCKAFGKLRAKFPHDTFPSIRHFSDCLAHEDLKFKDLITYTPNLTSLSFVQFRFPDYDFSLLQRFTAIQSLSFDLCLITDRDLRFLCDLPNLRSLQIGACRGFTLNGLASLGNLTSLQSLTLYGYTLPSLQSINFLRKFIFLRELNLIECNLPVTHERLSPFSALKSIETLYFSGMNINAVGVSYLSGLTSIKSLLFVSTDSINDQALSILHRFTTLRYLAFHYCSGITDSGVSELSTLTALQALDLSSCKKISDACLPHLSTLTSLWYLNLSDCKRITNRGLNELSHFTALRTLHLGSERITNEGVAYLSSLPFLVNLNLMNCMEITNAGLRNFNDFTSLLT